MPSPGARRAWIAGATVATGLAAIGPLLYLASGNVQILIVAASFVPYFAVPGVAGFVTFAAVRAWLGVGIGAVVLFAITVTIVPSYTSERTPAGSSASLTVFTGNLRYGLANAPDLLARAKREHADVLTFQELTPAEVTRLVTAGVDHSYPYFNLSPGLLDRGVGMWSRFPLTDKQSYSGFYDNEVSARFSFGSPTRQITLFSTHLIIPAPPPSRRWVDELKELSGILKATRGTVIDGGDFNATTYHAQFRQLLTSAGLHDGADQAGAGFIRTFPANAHYPSLVGIDHVLTRGVVATKVFAVQMPGSDHRGLIARIYIPRS